MIIKSWLISLLAIVLVPFVGIVVAGLLAGYASELGSWLWTWTPLFVLLLVIAVDVAIAVGPQRKNRVVYPGAPADNLQAEMQKVTATQRAHWE